MAGGDRSGVRRRPPDRRSVPGLVILGTALRFGLGASIWSSVVMAGMYLAWSWRRRRSTTRYASCSRRASRTSSAPVVAGLFSRVVIGRATENARLLQRVDEDERERERARERDLLSRLGRDFGASLDRATTVRAIAAGAGPLLADASLLLSVDDSTRRLVPEASGGGDQRSRSDGGSTPMSDGRGWGEDRRRRRRHRAAVEGHRADAGPGDPDGMKALDLEWVLVPIVAGGRLLGVLATAGVSGTRPDHRLRRLVEAVADRAVRRSRTRSMVLTLQDRMAREQAAQRVKDDFLSSSATSCAR